MLALQLRDMSDILSAVDCHRFEGVFIGRTADSDCLLTVNSFPGASGLVGGDRLCVLANDVDNTVYRVWNPFNCCLGAAIIGGTHGMHISRGSKVLFIADSHGGSASPAVTLSHISDLVGPLGHVFAVVFGEDALNSSAIQVRENITPIAGKGQNPVDYQQLIDGPVDILYVHMSQCEDIEHVNAAVDNAHLFLRDDGKGYFMVVINASDARNDQAAEVVFSRVRCALKELGHLVPKEQLTLEPFFARHALLQGSYEPR